MNKNKYIIIIFTIILIAITSFLSIKIYKNYNIKYDIQDKTSWTNYDNSIETIKTNMESITEPNENFDWWILKDFNIEDKEYEKILNLLVASVRMCYLDFTDDGTLYTNSNPIRKYKNKKYITKEELEKLNFDMYNEINHGGCLKRFEQYNALMISENNELRNNLLNKTNKIFTIKSTNLFTNQNASFNELLLRKTIEVHYIEDISEFLVEEYNRLK